MGLGVFVFLETETVGGGGELLGTVEMHTATPSVDGGEGMKFCAYHSSDYRQRNPESASYLCLCDQKPHWLGCDASAHERLVFGVESLREAASESLTK
jgi:hypothetical protein